MWSTIVKDGKITEEIGRVYKKQERKVLFPFVSVVVAEKRLAMYSLGTEVIVDNFESYNYR